MRTVKWRELERMRDRQRRRAKRKTMELQHWSHWQHPLVFNEDERSGRLCWGCVEPVFGPSYSCKKCREGSRFIHHKSCAELPLGLHHPSHPNHPLILFDKIKYRDNGNREEYNKFSNCDVCGERSNEYSYCCYHCNFNIHIRCSSLSLTIQTEVHDHQLTRIWKLMKFTCDFCGKEGNLPYHCAQCDFAIHSRCAACPRILKVFRHNHLLHLTPSLEVHQSDSPICLLCVRKVDTLCLYYCSRCDFVAHLYCAMLPSNREYINLQELKEEQSTESKSEDTELHQSFDSKICKVKKTTVGEDGTEIAIEIKHFSHKHDLKLTDEIPNNTKCNGVAADIKSMIDELKSKFKKDGQIFAKAHSKSSKECENSLKYETARFQALYEKFCKEKASHLQALKDGIWKRDTKWSGVLLLQV